MTLEEFINSDLQSTYIKFRGSTSYYRKGRVAVDGTVYTKVLTRANTTNRKRADNVLKLAEPKATGFYRALDQLTAELALRHGFQGIYVEGVLNEFLPEVLERYG
jgi:hypothetical protein